MPSRVYIETWGCQMNLRQSEGMAGILVRAGYQLVSSLEQADVVLFNGCMVRQKAEEKVLGRLGAVAQEKKKRRVLVGIGGCMGQVRADELLARSRIIDFVFGSSGHGGLPEWIERAAHGRISAAGDPRFVPDEPAVRASCVSGMVIITEGCSNFCAYCIVPYARGALRCRPPEQILSEVADLVQQGYREVLLLGQNVNAYRSNRSGFQNYAQLLDSVAQTGISRIRFTTSHPKDLSEQTLEVMADRPSVCPHLHLACQSGSTRILHAMNRGYDRSQYVSWVHRAREIVPALNVTTDLIVGFPGETEEDFLRTLNLVEEMRFGSVFVAKYSPRPKTCATLLADDVPADVKAERLERVLEAQRAIAAEENAGWIGRDVQVLVEGTSQNGRVWGRAPDHRTVVLQEKTGMGETVVARVRGASASSLEASILDRESAGGTR